MSINGSGPSGQDGGSEGASCGLNVLLDDLKIFASRLRARAHEWLGGIRRVANKYAAAENFIPLGLV